MFGAASWSVCGSAVWQPDPPAGHRLAAGLGVTSSPGPVIAETVSTGKTLCGSWEDTHIDIWVFRTGKTTSRAIPAILDAPGPVLVTSNKRDVVDATRTPGPRPGRYGCSTRREWRGSSPPGGGTHCRT